MHRFIDRDSENNIIAVFACEQKRAAKQEKITLDELKAQLESQPLQWDHGYE